MLDPTGFDAIDGNIVGSKIGMHFSGLAAHLPNDATLQNDMFTVDRVFEPRWPFTTGATPTVRRIFRTTTGNSQHPGLRGDNGKSIDLIDFGNREFYEIGPADDEGKIEEDTRKMQRVINGLQAVGVNGWSLGTSYVPPSVFPLAWATENFPMNFTPVGLRNMRRGRIAVARLHSPGFITYETFNTHIGDVLLAGGVAAIGYLTATLVSQILAASARSAAAGPAALLV